MSLLDTMKGLGRFARKGAKLAKKTLLLTAASIMLSTGVVKAQNGVADTLWANGDVLVTDFNTGNPISNANVLLIPDSVETVLPDTSFSYFSNNSGFVNYNIISGIDTTTGINEYNQKDNTRVFPTMGSAANIFFKDFEEGNINVYDMHGSLVRQSSFSADNYYLNMSDFSSGVYIINIQTGKGAFSQKFVKTSSPSAGRASRPSFDRLEARSSKKMSLTGFTAKYKVKVSATGYHSDSVFSYFSEGFNDQLQISLSPLQQTIDTLWGTGTVVLLNSMNSQYVNYANIKFKPDTIPDLTPDTSWIFQSFPGPSTYSVPTFIGSQTPGSSTADYKLSWNHPGFYPGDSILTINSGNNPIIILYADPLPPAVINIQFNVAEIAGAPITNVPSDSAFVYIKDMQGNKDSAWTVNGVVTFFDVGQNKDYIWGAGKNNMWGWNGATLTTPSGGLGDTITFEVGADLIPQDSVYSRKSGTMVAVDPAFLIDLHGFYNVQIGRMDTLRFYLSSSYSQSQVDSATAWIANYGAWTGINTKIENNQFFWPIVGFDPDTSDVSVLGVNISPGTSNCTTYGMQYNNSSVTTGANITNMFTTQAKLHKEIGRITFDEAASSFMSPTANNMSARDAAHADILYRLSEAYFNGLHSLPNLQYLISSSTFVPQ